MITCFNVQPALICAILLIMFSCDSKDPLPVNEYFPLTDGFAWNYKVVTDCDCNCPCAGFEDLMQAHQGHEYSISVKGDTVIDGKSYKQIRYADGSVREFIRQEETAYFARSYYGEETKFLDTSVPVGGSWVKQTNFDSEIINTIKSVRKNFIISNKLYRNVIEVEEAVHFMRDGHTGDCARIALYHYYASGLGEVYTYRPYNYCTYYSGDTHNYLVSATLL